ncbi:MAG: hypothetical protein IKT71_02220 [Paludibacteraceae bacterium]|nr:hypothetical protein [Paludibacteraceae bacterium]
MKKRRIIRILLLLLAFNITPQIYAEIVSNDIVSIKYIEGTTSYYLAANEDALVIKNIPDEGCLWKIEIIDNGQYAFQNIKTNRYLRFDNFQIILSDSYSYFTAEINSESANSIEGRWYYYYYNYYTFYIRCNTNSKRWETAQYKGNYGTLLTIEKWELEGAGGGEVEGTFAPESLDFGFTPTDINDAKTLTFTLTQNGGGGEGGYYYCVDRVDEVRIPAPTAAKISKNKRAIELKNIQFTWQSSGKNISKTRCSTLADSEVKEREMLELSWEKSTAEEDTWNLTVTAKGASPTNIVDANGDWIDYTDQIIATFTTEDETTHRVRANIRREAYHLQEWPTFEVTVSPTSYTYSKTGGPATFEVSCFHQNGADVIKSDGATPAGEIIREAPVKVTDASTITFVAKSMLDETNVDWLTVESINNGVVTVSASDNSQNNTEREARLVGVITYTDPDDANDTHTEIVVIPIKQRVKDGKTTFLPQKGFSNTEFGKNPYTHADEQMVHTAEKTIYYLPGENITLRIAETSFNGYYRWYDYQTGSNPQYNTLESDRTTWTTQPTGTLINNSNGDTHGIYSTNSECSTTPIIQGWADGKAHIIACDISNYTDYTTRGEGTQLDTIIEPTLSFRQLFHLRPAQEMAERFKAAAANQEFVENHKYTAPVGQTIYLTTDYRYAGGDESDRSYYYYTNGTDASGGYKCVGKGGVSAKWFEVNGDTYTNITPQSYTAKDYLPITESAVGRKVYELGVDNNGNNKIDDGDLRIARFVVDFVSNCGPESTTPLITRNEILNKYVLLEEIDFNLGHPAPGTSDPQPLNAHLPWAEASYGYTYPAVAGVPRNRESGSSLYIPYWGEYFITNKLSSNVTWAHTVENYTGAANGYALYVDGTSEPGLVASISTDATVCSGQTMYCSMWLNNVSNDGNANAVNPVFRCNIQGRKRDDDPWEDVGVFFVGALGRNNGKWSQINFPVLSDQESYAQTRVSIYNFATSAGGNDFMIDDIRLYASPLPLAAYHATTGCQSYTEEETTNTVVVLRIDYDYLNEDLKGENKHVYYEVFNETDSVTVQLKEKVGDVYQPIYYQDDKDNVSPYYGSILIPPTREGSGVPEKSDITSYINELTPQKGEKSKSGKCFVKDSGGKWFMYLVHVIPTGNALSGTDANVYLDRNKSYILRIAHKPEDLHRAACAFTTQLHATQDTYVQLHNDEVDSLRITSCMNNLCANNHHFLTVKVQNTIMPTVGGEMKTIEAQVHADWLTGFEFDDIYCNESAITSDAQTTANNAFLAKYGFERNAIEDAIAAMRNTSPDNPNYEVDNAKNLQVLNGHLTQEQRDLIVDLCNRGLLLLYQKSKMFYLGSAATARFWVYPVAEDATVSYEGVDYTLHDCNEPKWVKLTSVESEYGVNLSPILGEDQTPQQRLDVPSIRIIESTQRVAIPVKELLGSTMLSSQLTAKQDTVYFLFNKPTEGVIEYVDLSRNKVEIIDAPAKLEPGKDYLMRMAFYDSVGNVYIDGNPENCRVGYIYFYLSIVPNVVQWTGEESAIWGDDANWKARKADGTLMDVGFAPLPKTNVIIPTLPADKPYPIVTTDNHYPMDVNHLPNACNDIYFAPGAMIHNQHLLQYNRAFVDMTITPATWNSMAPPLKGMYTGDMYVPHSGNYSSGTNKESTEPFVVNSFDGARTSSAAYAFWQSIYNKRVPTYHENGNQSYPAITEDVKFVETNSLGHPLPPGTGYQVLGYGPDNISGDDIIVRLPKPDTYYSYYYSNGTPSDQGVSVTHSPKLAFEPDANGDMYITLTNALASNQFMFGNPAMANIDMAEFLKANPQLAKKYYTMSNSSWTANTWVTIEQSGTGNLAPMRSVLLELDEAKGTATSVTVKLSKSHFVGYTGPAPASLPARRNSATEESDESMLMTIYATNAGGQARCMVAAKSSASDIYESQEDALFISSGVETSGDGVTATSPINMYTVSKQVPMMVDVRANIDTVPLSMLVLNSYRTKKVKFAFYLSLNWNKECYLWDSKTDEKFRILDGLWLELDMPENYETRYFILGPDDTTNDDISSSTDRPVLPQVDTPIQLWAYSAQSGQLQVNSNEIIQHVKVYDLTGRLVAQQALDLYGHSMTLSVPTGMCIVEATMRDNTKRRVQALVR